MLCCDDLHEHEGGKHPQARIAEQVKVYVILSLVAGHGDRGK